MPGCSTEGSRGSRPWLRAPRAVCRLPRTADPQRPAPLPAYLPEPRSAVPGRPAAVAMRSPRCRSAPVRAGAAAPSPAHTPAPGASPRLGPGTAAPGPAPPEPRGAGRGTHRPPRGTAAPPGAVPTRHPRYPPDSLSPRSAPLTGRCGTGRAPPGRGHGRGHERCPTAAAALKGPDGTAAPAPARRGPTPRWLGAPPAPRRVPRVCPACSHPVPGAPHPHTAATRPPLCLVRRGRFQHSAPWRRRWGRNSLAAEQTPQSRLTPPTRSAHTAHSSALCACSFLRHRPPRLRAGEKRRALAQNGRRLPGACAEPPVPSVPAATGPGPP